MRKSTTPVCCGALICVAVAACDATTGMDEPVVDAGPDGSSLPVPDANTVDGTRPAGVTLCYTATAEAHPAVGQFRTALRTNDRASRAQVITALDAAATALPGEELVHLYLGLAHLWRLAEPLPGEDGLIAQLGDATGARDHLRTAYQLCPTDHRVAAWLGPVLVQFGRRLNDTAQIDEGLMILDQGIAAYPSFVLFSKLLVFADSPRTSPEFANAYEAVTMNLQMCAMTPNDPACTNATVPHNREGGFLYMADAMTKALQRDAAKAAYEAAQAEPDYPTWSYKATLTDRLQQLDSRISLYSNANASDDPAAAWGAANQCMLCHQE